MAIEGVSVEIVPLLPEHIPAAGRVLFEAFDGITRRHGYPPDFPTVEHAITTTTRLLESGMFRGFAAVSDGVLIGSNFLLNVDAVAGIGPISVDPERQGVGAGRLLMEAALDAAIEGGHDDVRLLQDAFNVASLALYARLGLDVIDTVGQMARVDLATSEAPNGVRPMTADDLPALAKLSMELSGRSRIVEIGLLLLARVPGYVMEGANGITGYVLPGLIGHGIATDVDDFLAMTAYAVSGLPSPATRILLPMSNAELFRKALEQGWRLEKVVNYMGRGAKLHRGPVWTPSILG